MVPENPPGQILIGKTNNNNNKSQNESFVQSRLAWRQKRPVDVGGWVRPGAHCLKHSRAQGKTRFQTLMRALPDPYWSTVMGTDAD